MNSVATMVTQAAIRYLMSTTNVGGTLNGIPVCIALMRPKCWGPLFRTCTS